MCGFYELFGISMTCFLNLSQSSVTSRLYLFIIIVPCKFEMFEYAKHEFISFKDSKDRKSTEDAVSTPGREHVVKDSSSTIWQKTVIAAVAEKSEENKENNKESLVISTIDDKVGTC